MKQKENFEKEIVEIAIIGDRVAINKKGIPVPCSKIKCSDCLLATKSGPCTINLKTWAESECVDPKEFTEEEKAILLAFPKANWAAKDKDGDVYLYTDKPEKSDNCWTIAGVGRECKRVIAKFDAIKWEDDEPTSREEILG